MHSSVIASSSATFRLGSVDDSHGTKGPESSRGSTGGTHIHTRTFRLTPRQQEVLGLLCEGLSNKRICRELAIANPTVKVHVRDILRKLGVSSRLQAVVAAHNRGLVPKLLPEEPRPHGASW